MAQTLTEVQAEERGRMITDEQIVAIARSLDALPELCNLVDYDPRVGRVPEHWVPQWHVRALVNALSAAR